MIMVIKDSTLLNTKKKFFSTKHIQLLGIVNHFFRLQS